MIGPAFALLLSASSPTPAFSALPDSCLVFAQPQHDFGEAFAGSRLTHSFRVTNRCPQAVKIASVGGRAQLGPGRPGKDVLAPGEAGEVLAYQLLGDDLGRRRYRFEVTANLPGSPTWELSLQGFVLSTYDPPQPEVSLGDVDVAEGKAGRVELYCRETGTVRLPARTAGPASRCGKRVEPGPRPRGPSWRLGFCQVRRRDPGSGR